MSKSSNRKSSKQSKEKNNDFHKVIIRCLPSNLTGEQFLEQISPLPTYNYFRFVAADNSYGRHSFSRAYINFVNAKSIVQFFEKYDGYPITDNKGKQYPAIVELAPFQGIPKKKKRDPKCGTIESDKDYLTFLACLEEKKDSTHITEAPIDMEDTKNDTLSESTPLLDYLKVRKSGNKLKYSQLQASASESEKKRKKEKKTESSVEQSETGNSKKSAKHDPPKNSKESSKPIAKGKGSANYKVEKIKEKNEPNTNNEHKTSTKSKDRAPEKREPPSKKVMEQRHNYKDKSRGTETEKRINDNDKDHKTKATSSSSKRSEARQSDVKSERRSKSASKKSVDQPVPHEKSKKDRISATREDISVKKKSSEEKRHDSSTKINDNRVNKMGDRGDQPRRIRNKDRPDRAVYNPRQRFGRSAEVEELEEKHPRSSRSQSSKK